MKYTNVALKEKIREMYPDIEKHKVSVSLTFSEEKNAYILKFKRGKQELITQIDKLDADDCMNNIRCLHLGIKVDTFVRNFEAREEFGRKVA
jgi:soluble cytochrome b562